MQSIHGTGKYAKADFTTVEVQPWTPNSNVSCAGFRCKRPEFGSYWKKRIPRDVASHLGRCWVICSDNTLVAYITLFNDKLTVENLLADEDIQYDMYPAAKIGLLATDERVKGAATCLLKWAVSYVAKAISPKIGVRFITVDALFDPDTGYDTSGYYEAMGFLFANPNEKLPPPCGYRTMYLDIKYLIDKYHPVA